MVVRSAFVFGWNREISVEFLLLFGGKQRANLIVRPRDERLMFGPKVLMKLHHLVVGIAHKVLNLSQLIGGQAQIAIEPIDERSMEGDVENLMAIGEVGKGETDQ